MWCGEGLGLRAQGLDAGAGHEPAARGRVEEPERFRRETDSTRCQTSELRRRGSPGGRRMAPPVAACARRSTRRGPMVRKLVAAGALSVLAVACAKDTPAPTGAYEVRVPLYASRGGMADFNLGTHMTGDEEVFVPAVPGGPTPADSRAQGEAIFRVSADGHSVDFRLIASNIDNVIMSHIHCGRPGENGP